MKIDRFSISIDDFHVCLFFQTSEIDRFQRDRDFSINTEQIRTPNNTINPFQLSSQQNNTIDNLVEKLENHIASELDR